MKSWSLVPIWPEKCLPKKNVCLKEKCSVCRITFLSGWHYIHVLYFPQVNSCQLSNSIISMVDCVLTLFSCRFDITAAFIEEVEKVERKQNGKMHSSTRQHVVLCHQRTRRRNSKELERRHRKPSGSKYIMASKAWRFQFELHWW